MSWVGYVLLVTPDTSRTAAAALFAQMSGSAADASPEAFSVALAPAADPAQITHWACHTRIRQHPLATLPALAQAIPGSLWHVTSLDADPPGTERTSALDYLAAQGLTLYTPPEETP